MMLDKSRLQLAIEIHGKCYGLLKWIDKAIVNGTIVLDRHHNHPGMNETAQAWFQEYYSILPIEYRPPREQLREFANYFSTYLTTSFDLADVPCYRQTTDCGCFCSLCSYLTQASRLQTKKVTKQDKTRAERLMELRLESLAKETGCQIDSKKVEMLLQPRNSLRRSAAYSTYGHWLLERLEGFTDGVSLLALWREFAYGPTGSPLKEFKLNLEDFVRAEEELVEFMKTTAQ